MNFLNSEQAFIGDSFPLELGFQKDYVGDILV
jgi:hypothetical protein